MHDSLGESGAKDKEKLQISAAKGISPASRQTGHPGDAAVTIFLQLLPIMHYPAAEFDELDLSIPNLNTIAEETEAGKILGALPGVEAVRMIERGAWVSYRPAVLDHHRICQALRAVGYEASVFQDSKTGETGTSSV